jgi:hypothetical protein
VHIALRFTKGLFEAIEVSHHLAHSFSFSGLSVDAAFERLRVELSPMAAKMTSQPFLELGVDI